VHGGIDRPGAGTEKRNVTKKKDNPFEEPVEIELEKAEASGFEPEMEPDVAELESAAVEAAQAEVAKMREAMLRMQAETENTRKRLTRELDRSRKMALERVMKDLLQVRDTLERGLDIDPEAATVEALAEGQTLTLKMLDKVLQDHHLEVVDPAGEPFDPEQHEAMTVLPSAEHEENTVMEVIQKGFRLHDRLIRPARVVVSAKP
jgi:molecular chaperone GrpE